MIKELWTNALYKKDATHIKNLQQCNLLKDLNHKQLHYLLTHLHKRSYQKKENIFEQDSTGNATYIILEGSVDIHYKEAKADSDNTEISTLQAGSFFGETNLYQKTGVRAVSAISNKKTILLSLFKSDLLQLSKVRPKMVTQLLLNIGEVLSTRIEQITQSHL